MLGDRSHVVAFAEREPHETLCAQGDGRGGLVRDLPALVEEHQSIAHAVDFAEMV